MKQSIEDIEVLLTGYEEIDLQKRQERPSEFNRIIDFAVNGKKYQIEWWTNVLYLYSDDLMVSFDHLAINGNWPNKHILSIVLETKTKIEGFYRTAAIIPLRKYKRKEENHD